MAFDAEKQLSVDQYLHCKEVTSKSGRNDSCSCGRQKKWRELKELFVKEVPKNIINKFPSVWMVKKMTPGRKVLALPVAGHDIRRRTI